MLDKKHLLYYNSCKKMHSAKHTGDIVDRDSYDKQRTRTAGGC
jgi:hypothetical protein